VERLVHCGSRPPDAFGRRKSSSSGVATGVGPAGDGNAASTNRQPTTGCEIASTITGTNKPALLCATMATGCSALEGTSERKLALRLILKRVGG
jgi:hypothetical protein